MLLYYVILQFLKQLKILNIEKFQNIVEENIDIREEGMREKRENIFIDACGINLPIRYQYSLYIFKYLSLFTSKINH